MSSEMSDSTTGDDPGGAEAHAPAPGTIYVVSAPSGAGKTTLVRALVDGDPDLVLSVSHTTRRRRPSETDGVHYHFVAESEFRAMIEQGAFLESARVFGHYYGTSRQAVREQLERGRDVVLEIDWQGARQVRVGLPEAVGIFILPPSREALASRLKGRGQDSQAEIERRLREAVAELAHYDEFDYLVVNDDLERALGDLQCVVRSRRLCRSRQARRHRHLLHSLLA